MFLISGQSKSALTILANRVYYTGASSSPSAIYVTKVEGDTYFYKNLPLRKGSPELHDAIKYGTVMLSTGCTTKLNELNHYLTACKNNGDQPEQYFIDEVAHLKSILIGEGGTQTPEGEHNAYEVVCKICRHWCAENDVKQDRWYLIDALTGGCCNGYRETDDTYTCSVFGDSAFDAFSQHPAVTVIEKQLSQHWEA